MKPLLILSLFVYLLFTFCMGQAKTDSLEASLRKANEDSVKIRLLLELSMEAMFQNSGNALKYAQDGLLSAKRLNDNSQIAKCYLAIGDAFKKSEMSDKAVENYHNALDIYSHTENKKGIGDAYLAIALVYSKTGKYQEAVEQNIRALKTYEELKELGSVSKVYSNLGAIYYFLTDYEKAISYWQNALSIDEQLSDKQGIAKNRNNIGLIHEKRRDYDSALVYHKNSLKIKEELGDKVGISSSLNNIANIHFHKGETTKAIQFWKLSLKIKEEIGDQPGISNSLQNIGFAYYIKGEYEPALDYIDRGLKKAIEINSRHYIKEGYGKLADVYSKLKEYEKAFEYQQLFGRMKDTIFNEQSAKQMTELEKKYQTEKKEKENEILKQNNEIKQLEINRQQVAIFAGAGGLLLLLALAFVLFRSNAQKQKTNVLITGQKKEIELQRDEITLQKKDLTDSIEYAKTLQQAILPDIEVLKNVLPDLFVYFRPRDIVSGDFYWFLTIKEKLIIIVADCTGHGVPGAFVSMLCNNLLNHVIIEKGVQKSGEILMEVNREVLSAFRKEGAKVKANDGMDCVLCNLDKSNLILEFAGAMNPLIIVRNGVVMETKGDGYPIGGNTHPDFSFTTHRISLLKDDLVYLFSDGFADQFGGVKSKKYMMKNFKQLLSKVAHLPADEQKELIHKAFVDWKGREEQVDDVLVIGFRV